MDSRKVLRGDCPGWASGDACTASRTLFKIDVRQIVLDFDCAEFALSLAKLAANTTFAANLAGNRAFISI